MPPSPSRRSTSKRPSVRKSSSAGCDTPSHCNSVGATPEGGAALTACGGSRQAEQQDGAGAAARRGPVGDRGAGGGDGGGGAGAAARVRRRGRGRGVWANVPEDGQWPLHCA